MAITELVDRLVHSNRILISKNHVKKTFCESLISRLKPLAGKKSKSPDERYTTELAKASCCLQYGLQHPEIVSYDPESLSITYSRLDEAPLLNTFKAMSQTQQNELSSDSLRLLRQIHDLGLSHGDPCLNNFGVHYGSVFFFDLESDWASSNPRLHDLITLTSDLYVNNGQRMQVFELVADTYGQFEKDKLGQVWSAYYKFRYGLPDKALSFFCTD